jgi:hypothetical protein
VPSGEWSPESGCGDHDYFEDNQSSGYGVELEVDAEEHRGDSPANSKLRREAVRIIQMMPTSPTPCSSPAVVCPCGCGDEDVEHSDNYVVRKAQSQMESLCEISRWFREEQEKERDATTKEGDDDDDDDGEETDDQRRATTKSESSGSCDAWTPVLVQPTYGPCNRCYPRHLKFAPNNHVTPPPTPPEERDKFECLYLLVDTAISRMECERGQPWK